MVAFGICGPLTIFPRQSSTYREDYHNLSHEVNFSSTTDGPLQWIAGLYNYHEGYIQPVFTTLHDQPQLDGPITASVPSVTGAVPRDFRRRLYDDRTKFEQDSYAAYGQVDWKFAEHWKATLGLRYSTDALKGTESVRAICFATTACGTTPELLGTFTPAVDITAAIVHRGEVPVGVVDNGQPGGVAFANGFAMRTYNVDFHATTGTAGIQWEPDDDTLAYFRYSRGYKMGGINSGVTSSLGRFPYTGPEHIDAFDFGFKKNFGRTLQTNISIFHYPYKDLQAPLTVANNTGGLAVSESRFVNVPKAVTQGIEIETTWAPIEHLQILANYSYDDAHIKTLTNIIDPNDPSARDPRAKPLSSVLQACTGTGSTPTPANPSPNPLCDTATGLVQRAQNLSGNSLPQAPKHKVAINVTYSFEFEPGTLTPSVSYVWRDKQYSGLFERSYNAAPSWDQVDARLIWRDKDRRYTFIAYVKNVFDTLGYDGGAGAGRVSGTYANATVAASGGGVTPGLPAPLPGTVNGVEGFATSYAISPPRTYGLELQYRF